MIEQTHHYSLVKGYNLHWYQIKSVLGRGGNGITYLARDRNLDRLVAIKEYLPIDCALREPGGLVKPMMESCANLYYKGLTRFLKEAKTLAKFVHPNIVRVHSVFEENNTAYMVMEYEQGQNLSQFYKHRKNISEQALLNIFVPILKGLLLVHQSGFIHRDIKPANIYIREDLSPVLLDFGSARDASNDLTRTLTVLATHGYTPFEQYNQSQAKQGPWSDIYSLGATIYNGVTGKKPIDSLKRAGSIIGGSGDLFVPMTSLEIEGYSQHFLLAVDNALLFHPKDRPPDISQWVDMLSGKVTPPPLPKNFIKHPVRELIQKKAKTKISERKNESLTEYKPRTSPSSSMLGDLTPLAEHREMGSVPDSSSAKNHNENNGQKVIAPTVSLVYPKQNQPSPVSWWSVSARVVVIVFAILSVTLLLSLWFQDDKNTQIIVNGDSEISTGSRINELLAQANRAAKEKQYIAPETNNALAFYSKALQIDPNNGVAKAGIEMIVEHFTQQIQTLIDAGELVRAEELLQIMDSVALKSTGFLQLQLLLRKAKENRSKLISDLMSKGQKAFIAGNMIKPEQGNALQFYREVLKLEPLNQEAKLGLQQIHDYFFQQASQHIAVGEFDQAKAALAVMQSAVPDSNQAQLIKTDILKFEEKNLQINRFLQQAETDEKSGRFVKPDGNSALYRYRQVLTLEKDNEKAKQGIENLMKYYEAQFYSHVAENRLTKAEEAAEAVALISPNSQLRKKLKSELEQLKKPVKPELEEINDLIYEFKQTFETSNLAKLLSLSVYSPGRQKFLEQFFDQYRLFKLEITDFAYITKEHRALAVVSLSDLINREGEYVKPGTWNKFYIQIAKNDKGKWKVHW